LFRCPFRVATGVPVRENPAETAEFSLQER
jgi:hypothetical protein